MKKINILSTILAIGMLLGLASCDLDNNKNSSSLELDDDAVALVENFIYVTPETKGNKGFKITLLYDDRNSTFWDNNRYVEIEVNKLVDIRALRYSRQANIHVGDDNQQPTAEDPVKVIYFPFVEAGESYVFVHNTNFSGSPVSTESMEALCGAGEIHSISPAIDYWNDGYKRLVSVNATNKQIDACMDDVTIPYELKYIFEIRRNYDWVTGQNEIEGDHPFFKELLTSDGADILSENQFFYNTKDEIDAGMMDGSTASYYQNNNDKRINLSFFVSALLDADTYGSCMYKFVFAETGPAKVYYSKDTNVRADGFDYTDTWNGLTRTWKYNQYNNLEKCTATDTWNDLTRTWWFNANGTFNECNAYDDWNGYTRKWVFNSDGSFKQCTVEAPGTPDKIYNFNESGDLVSIAATDTWSGKTRNWVYDLTDTFVSCTATDTWSGKTRTWNFDSTGVFVSCTATDTWRGKTRTWTFNSTGAFVSCTAEDTWDGKTRTWTFNSTGAFVSCTTQDGVYSFNSDGDLISMVNAGYTPARRYYYNNGNEIFYTTDSVTPNKYDIYDLSDNLLLSGIDSNIKLYNSIIETTAASTDGSRYTFIPDNSKIYFILSAGETYKFEYVDKYNSTASSYWGSFNAPSEWKSQLKDTEFRFYDKSGNKLLGADDTISYTYNCTQTDIYYVQIYNRGSGYGAAIHVYNE